MIGIKQTVTNLSLGLLAARWTRTKALEQELTLPSFLHQREALCPVLDGAVKGDLADPVFAPFSLAEVESNRRGAIGCGWIEITTRSTGAEPATISPGGRPLKRHTFLIDHRIITPGHLARSLTDFYVAALERIWSYRTLEPADPTATDVTHLENRKGAPSDVTFEDDDGRFIHQIWAVRVEATVKQPATASLAVAV